jgi:uncharacterized protein
MRGETRWTCVLSREGWETVTRCVTTLSCTQTDWVIEDSVEAFYKGEIAFSRNRKRKIARDAI